MTLYRCGAVFVTQPLDLIKNRMQLSGKCKWHLRMPCALFELWQSHFYCVALKFRDCWQFIIANSNSCVFKVRTVISLYCSSTLNEYSFNLEQFLKWSVCKCTLTHALLGSVAGVLIDVFSEQNRVQLNSTRP